ncbi:MAG: hypothetical protein CME06_13105 [Gemmatimonadetes bacterium]|nr:hypothetical protein [Gemmatimonadota bacterium]
MQYQVGLLYFTEALGDALLESINASPRVFSAGGREIELVAKHMKITEFDIDHESRYSLVIDRASHRLEIARGVLMSHAFRGVHVINNPLSFHYFIAHKDVGYSIVRRLGVRVPATFILPPHSSPRLERGDFKFHRHFQWDKMMSKVGFPCYLKPAEGRGAEGVSLCNDMQELLEAYDASGDRSMTVQAAVSSPHEWHLRCLCVGREIIVMKYIFRPGDRSEYLPDKSFLTVDQGREVVDSCRIINRAFGYEMNSVEFVIDDKGDAWAIDFNNPVPDGRPGELGENFFEDYVGALTRRAAELARFPVSSLFLPDLNAFSAIAQLEGDERTRRQRALEQANRFYEPATEDQVGL